MRRREAFRFRHVRRSENFADSVVSLDVCYGIRARRSANWRLVNENHVVNLFRAVDFPEKSNLVFPFAANWR